MKTPVVIAVILGVIIVVLLALLFFLPVPASAPAPAPIPTSAPTSTPTSSPVQAGSGSPVASSTAPFLVVTQANNGSIIHLAKNESFLIQFSNNVSWRFVFQPDGIITAGSGGVYRATAIGTTVLHASGAPICKPGEACPQFILEMIVTFVVQ